MRLRSRYPVPKRLPGRRFILAGVVPAIGLLALLLTSSCAVAQTFTLRDGNAEARLDVSDPLVQETLLIDEGPPVYGETAFWWAGFGPPYSVQVGQAANGDVYVARTMDSLMMNLYAVTRYSLAGSPTGSGEATLTETMWLHNFSFGNVGNIRVVQHSHYTLSQTPGPQDTVSMPDALSVRQTGDSATLEAHSDAAPIGHLLGDGEGMFDALSQSGWGDRLPNTPPIGSPASGFANGPGWALEWAPPLYANSKVTVSTVTKRFTLRKQPPAIPEPASLALLATGAPVLLVFRPRKALK